MNTYIFLLLGWWPSCVQWIWRQNCDGAQYFGTMHATLPMSLIIDNTISCKVYSNHYEIYVECWFARFIGIWIFWQTGELLCTYTEASGIVSCVCTHGDQLFCASYDRLIRCYNKTVSLHCFVLGFFNKEKKSCKTVNVFIF